MAIERRAVKKRVLKSGRDRTDTAVYVLLKYGVVDDADQAFKIVSSKDEVLMPSELSYYTDQVDQDLGMGRSSLEVVKIRNALAEFYGLYEPEEDDVEPDELDDLLGSIRAEEEPSAPSSSALAIYEGVGGEDIVDEEIDDRILNLLKLDGVHDIDYATYLTLLKERMVAGRMADSSMPTEEVELLTDEFRRVKGKVGRFRLKKKKTITAEDMAGTGPVRVSDDQFFLTSSAVIPGKTTSDTEEEDDAEILKKLDDILTSLKMENKEEKKKAKKDKKDKEDAKRKAAEKKLEAKKRKEFTNLIKTVVAPVTSLLEKIMNWIKWTFIGFIFNQALAWFRDPENQNKVKAIGSFLKAFWPAILAAAVLFLTPFGAFIRSTIKLLRWAVPKLLGIIKKNPKLFAAAALVGAGAMIPRLFPGTVNEQETKISEAAGSKEEKIAALKKQKENLNPLQIIQGVGSEIDEQIKFLETGETASYGAAPGGRVQPGGGGMNADLDEMPTIEGMSGGGEVINNYGMFGGSNSRATFTPIFGLHGGGITLPNVSIPNMNTNVNLMSGGGMLNVNDIRFSGGGGVTSDTGVDIKGAGADTQLTALQPGEIVMSKNAVNYWGANTLLGMNKAGGGTNTPKMANNIQMASGGGMVGSTLDPTKTAASMSGSTLDPTKTAASMPHVFKAAQQARARARAAGLPPEEVERRVIEASEQAKKAGPPKQPHYLTGMPTAAMTPKGMNPLPVPVPEVNKETEAAAPAPPAQSIPVTGSIPSTPFKSERLNNALTGITADAWKKSSSAEKIEEVEPGSEVIPKATAKSNPLTSELVMGGNEKTNPVEFKSKSGMDYSSAIKIDGSKSLKRSVPSSMAPVTTPRRNSQPAIINLPTKTSKASPPAPSIPSAPSLPKFSSSRPSGKRQTTLAALGITDLVTK